MKRRKEDLTTFNSPEKLKTLVLYSFHLFYILKGQLVSGLAKVKSQRYNLGKIKINSK